jgi:AraC-like DNA-binding protein
MIQTGQIYQPGEKVSLHFGYDSPTSFTQAFQALQGVNSTEAKKEDGS